MSWSFSGELKKRVEANKNALIGVFGTPGSGKSYASLTIAEKTDPTFNIDRVCFSIEEFLAQIRSGLPRGAAIILDEAAVSANARLFYSLQNRLLNFILITFRSSNLVCFLNLPHSSMLDSQARKLLHFSVQPVTINRTENHSILKILHLESHPWNNEIYKKHQVHQGRVKVTEVICPLPSKELIQAYEAKKADFRAHLEGEIETELKETKDRQNQNKTKDFASEVAVILENPHEFEKVYSGRTFLDANLIKSRFNVGEGSARKIKANAEAKLYPRPNT